MAADPCAHADAPAWVAVSNDPPAVFLDGTIWLVCPLQGFECARIPQQPFGVQWGLDVMAVHVTLHHRRWPTTT